MDSLILFEKRQSLDYLKKFCFTLIVLFLLFFFFLIDLLFIYAYKLNKLGIITKFIEA